MKILLFLIFILITHVCSSGADLKVILSEVPSDYQKRYRETYRISSLSETDYAKLVKFLSRLPKNDPAAVDELASLKNNVADAVIRNEAFDEDDFEALFSAFRDLNQGDTWRNYIVQKIPDACLRLKDSEIAGKGISFLRAQADNLEGEFTIEATVGLERIFTANADIVNRDEMVKRCIDGLHSVKKRPALNAVLLDILARLDKLEGKKEAFAVLNNLNATITERSVAISAIGRCGSLSDAWILEPYANAADIRLRESARTALNRLKDIPKPVQR